MLIDIVKTCLLISLVWYATTAHQAANLFRKHIRLHNKKTYRVQAEQKYTLCKSQATIILVITILYLALVAFPFVSNLFK